MEWIEAFKAQLPALSTLAKFALVMAIIVGIPALTRRFRWACFLSGVLLGPNVLGLAAQNHPIVQFFGDLGRLMLMFSAGLEIDLNRFRQAQGRSITFGIVTTMAPVVREEPAAR